MAEDIGDLSSYPQSAVSSWSLCLFGTLHCSSGGATSEKENWWLGRRHSKKQEEKRATSGGGGVSELGVGEGARILTVVVFL